MAGGSSGGGGSTQRAAARALARHAPLVLAGLGRVLAVRAVAYHQVHSEYGAHWNLFLTLAVVSAVAPLVERRRALAGSIGRRAACACALVAAHQLALTRGGLSEPIRTGAPRRGLVAANREGLSSLPGYLALSLASASAADGIYHATTRPRARPGAPWPALAVVTAAALGVWAAADALDWAVEPTSRCLCNAAYVAWSLASVVLLFALCHLGPPTLTGAAAAAEAADTRPLPLLGAVDRHPLAFFLAANVLTGAVNLSIDTQSVGAPAAVALLSGYMAALCGGAVAADRWLTRSALRAAGPRASS